MVVPLHTFDTDDSTSDEDTYNVLDVLFQVPRVHVEDDAWGGEDDEPEMYSSDDEDPESLEITVDIENAEELRVALAEGFVDPNDLLEEEPILCLVANLGASESVDVLLRAGADPNLHSRHVLPVDFAVMSGCLPAANLLMQSGPLPGFVPTGLSVNWAVRYGHWEMAILAAEYGYDLELEEIIGGDTALIAAISHTPASLSVRVVRAFYEAGADLNHGADRRRNTPLMQAARGSDLDLVRELVCLGANPLARDTDGKTAADHAQDPDIAQYLANPLIHENCRFARSGDD